MANCPICGRHLGEFTNDPLLTTPSLSTDEFKGFTQLIRTHIEELQAERHQQEIDNGITPLTEFSPINDSGFFQNIKPYIQELRDSTEKILVITGQTLPEFLSTDEDGNPMTSKSNWTDSNLEEIKYQCKAIHIEDLRHFIKTGWMETWTGVIYSDSVHTSGWLPPSDSHSGIIHADHDWLYGVGVGVGNAGGDAIASINLASNFLFSGSNEINTPVGLDYGSASSTGIIYLYLSPRPKITEHTRFQISLGNYTELGSVTGHLPTDPILWHHYYDWIPFPTELPLPSKPSLRIQVTLSTGEYIFYTIATGGRHTIVLTPSEFASFDRNIIDDFKIFYGPYFTSGYVDALYFTMDCHSNSWDNYFDQQPESIHYMYLQKNSCIIGMSTIKFY